MLLLMKKQALRMVWRRNSHSAGTLRELLWHFAGQPLSVTLFLSSTGLRTDSPELAVDAGAASCPRKECANVRKSVIQNAVTNGSCPSSERPMKINHK